MRSSLGEAPVPGQFGSIDPPNRARPGPSRRQIRDSRSTSRWWAGSVGRLLWPGSHSVWSDPGPWASSNSSASRRMTELPSPLRPPRSLVRGCSAARPPLPSRALSGSGPQPRHRSPPESRRGRSSPLPGGGWADPGRSPPSLSDELALEGGVWFASELAAGSPLS